VRDRRQLEIAFDTLRPDTVFHAAAYKHVPMLELQPWKAIKNNILGARNLVDFANRFKVERFVFVSTDKAVRPANVMGASKRVAEMLVQGQNGCGLSNTRFMTVRFGNVVGSVGSVIPLFQKQIARGGPITVTHPEVTRYFMTIPEACQLILQAGSMGEGGEIFILDMGTPIRISDMARDLIRLSGFEPDGDIKIEYVGLRPGEKLFEELITEGEGIIPTNHEKILMIKGAECNLDTLNGKIDELRRLAYDQDADGIKAVLQEIVPDYRPRGGKMVGKGGWAKIQDNH
jgi:FlaA1/EpsC-like NDP-sugar epimerase